MGPKVSYFFISLEKFTGHSLTRFQKKSGKKNRPETRKSLNALTHSKSEARKKKQRRKKKTAFLRTHSNFAQNWSKTKFSREIKKYDTFGGAFIWNSDKVSPNKSHIH